MALDPERVGLENIEVPQVCDFGDNVLDYLTRGGHACRPQEEEEEEDDTDSDEDGGTDDAVPHATMDDESDNDSNYSYASASSVSTLPDTDYCGILPLKLVAFLQS
jgi:hypothetical protein